jgi:hypothetical protein
MALRIEHKNPLQTRQLAWLLSLLLILTPLAGLAETMANTPVDAVAEMPCHEKGNLMDKADCGQCGEGGHTIFLRLLRRRSASESGGKTL